MTALRAGLPPLPRHMKHLPIDPRGYPIPAFVATLVGGVRDFRVTDPDFARLCVRKHLCWICGEPLGTTYAFIGGPMCVIQRISGEPPSHRECSEYAMVVCPFIALPNAGRRDAPLPAGSSLTVDLHAAERPAIYAMWMARGYGVAEHNGTPLYVMSDPVECLWYVGGKPAPRGTVLEALDALRATVPAHKVDRAALLEPP